MRALLVPSSLAYGLPVRARRIAARCVAGIALAGLCAVAHGQGAVEAGSGYKDAVRAEMTAALGYRARAVMPQATETVVAVVEYYNAALKHYFITADAAEISNPDGGAFGGAWVRTGQIFNAWALEGRPAGSVPVCRFFGTDQYRANGTRIGPNSHFYTSYVSECAYVKTAWQSVAADGKSYPAWTYEAEAFAVKLPAAGACPAGT